MSPSSSFNPINAHKLVTHYIKIYPDRLKLIKYKEAYQLRSSNSVPNKTRSSSWIASPEEIEESIKVSIQKSKSRISDLVLCNQFDMFVTHTSGCKGCIPLCTNSPCSCDKKTCKRYDPDFQIQRRKHWYNNQIKRYGRWPYIEVMELHKDGALHFHALYKNFPGKLTFYRVHPQRQTEQYNLTGDRTGLNSAEYVRDLSKVSNYIKKYITKDMPTFSGHRRFRTSQHLLSPVVIENHDLALEITLDKRSSIYTPKRELTLRPDGSVGMKSSIIESITTVLLDNHANFKNQTEFRKRVIKPAKRITALQSRIGPFPLNSNSQAISVNSLTEDSSSSTISGLGT